MKYTLQKDNVIYIVAGRKQLKLNIIQGKIWLTKETDSRDLILVDDDSISLRNCGKVAIKAFEDSCFLLEGKKFTLHELIKENKRIRINKVQIGQGVKSFRPSIFDGIFSMRLGTVGQF
jgi:hypothetical protein